MIFELTGGPVGGFHTNTKPRKRTSNKPNQTQPRDQKQGWEDNQTSSIQKPKPHRQHHGTVKMRCSFLFSQFQTQSSNLVRMNRSTMTDTLNLLGSRCSSFLSFSRDFQTRIFPARFRFSPDLKLMNYFSPLASHTFAIPNANSKKILSLQHHPILPPFSLAGEEVSSGR